MRTMPRVLLLLFLLSVLTMMFVARCGLNMDAPLLHHHHHQRQQQQHHYHQQQHDLPTGAGAAPLPVLPSHDVSRVYRSPDGEQGSATSFSHLKQVLRQREAEHSLERLQLEDKIRVLEHQLRSLQFKVNSTSTLSSSNQSDGAAGIADFRAAPPLQKPPPGGQWLEVRAGGSDPNGSKVARSDPKANMEGNANVVLFPSGGNNVGSNESLAAMGQLQDLTSYFAERLQSAEVLKGFPYKTEYEVPSFNRFTLTRIYLVEPGLGKRVIEKPIGAKKKDLYEIIAYGIDRLNANRTAGMGQGAGQGQGQGLYSYEDFVEGIYRTEPAAGTHYELYFRNRDDQHPPVSSSYAKVVVFRPFGPPMVVASTVTLVREQWINLILPLSGRLDTFRHFMQRFVTVCVQQDRRVYLTVVYFGSEGLAEVKALMSAAARQHRYKHMKLITLNEKFARGRGLQIGALNWKSGDVLLFFCDVDVVFGQEFLERCRSNAEMDRRVYYPIVFSLYNPKIVYALQDMPTPVLDDQLIISKDSGFWRDFGYGMTCQYRSDFLKIKGFDEQIEGWGGEDVLLYQKFVKSDQYQVIRATDPGLFHLWHEKRCDPALSQDQYRSCIRSKALSEASHSQLGLLAFKDEIDVHRSALHRAEIKEQVVV